MLYQKGCTLWKLRTDIWVPAAACRKPRPRWQRPYCDEGCMRSDGRWEWDVRCSPGLSSQFVSRRRSPALSLLPWEAGRRLVAGPVRLVPRGTTHMAAAPQSLSGQLLLSFHLGGLPRVAARDMREEVASEEMACYFLGSWLPVCA